MGQVAVMLADGFEEIEALTVVDILRRGGVDAWMISIMGRLDIIGGHDIPVIADMLYEAMDFTDVDMIVLPGGLKGKENLENYKPLNELITKFIAEDKYVTAICAAPTILGRMGVLKGKEACCYGGMETELEGAKVSYEKVVKDGKIITSRGMGTAIDFSLALLAEYKGQEVADDMAKKIMFA